MGAAEKAVVAPGVAFREMEAGDIPAGLGLCRASRWNQTARDWEQFLSMEPHGARVAVRDGRVIGTVATVRYQRRFGWIGMVLVDPAERGRGVGTELLHKGLEALADMPCSRLDATPAGHPLYRKLGFRDEYGLARMERAASIEAPATDTGAARPMETEDLLSVSAVDRQVFGADRSPMLEWLWAGAREYAWIVADRGGVRGYALGRCGHDFDHVGPVVAEDVAIARQLVAACLAERRDRPVILDATRHSEEWRRWLEAVGFREQRPFIRMFLGRHDYPGLPERQFAILGPEFG